MKKSFMGITVALVVAAFTVSAWAGYNERPQALRNASFSAYGIQIFKSATVNATNYNSVLNSSLTGKRPGVYFMPGNASASVNATFSTNNGTLLYNTIRWVNGTQAASGANATKVYFSKTYVGQIPGTIQITANRTIGSQAGAVNTTINFLAAPDYSLMAGIGNRTFFTTKAGDHRAYGADLLVMAPMRADNINTAKLAGTWYFYALTISPQANKTVFKIGQMDINTGGATSAKVKIYDGRYLSTNTTTSPAPLSYRIKTFGKGLAISNNTAWTGPTGVLFSNGTVSQDNSTMIGVHNSVANRTLFVAIKSGVVLSSSDIANRYLKTVAIGQNGTARNSTTQMNAFLANDALTISTGNSTQMDAGKYAISGSMAGMKLALGSKSYATVTQSNATFKTSAGSPRGSFIGRWAANKKFGVGIWNGTSGQYGMMFIFPTAATTGNFSKALATTSYWANTTLCTLTRVATISSTPVTDQMLTRYNLSGVMPVTEMKSFNATAPGTSSVATALFTGTYTVQGLAGNINNLRLYKVNNNTRATMLFNRADTRQLVDGSWWIEQATGQLVDAGGPIGSGTVVGTNSILDPTVVYNVYYVIRQGGSYNLGGAKANFAITDPQFIGQIIPGGSSSSSSTGCTFNPSAGFGLEWLLLLIAPAIGILRSRFKK